MNNFLGWTDEQIEDLINRVYGGVVSRDNLPVDLYQSILDRMEVAIVEGFGLIGDEEIAATTFASFSDNIKNSAIQEEINVTDGKVALAHILDGYKSIITLQREILNMAGEINDEGTVSQMSDYITLQEKEAWMFRSYLS